MEIRVNDFVFEERKAYVIDGVGLNVPYLERNLYLNLTVASQSIALRLGRREKERSQSWFPSLSAFEIERRSRRNSFKLLIILRYEERKIERRK